MTTLTINRLNADEAKRANLAREAISQLQLDETKRHNLATESLAERELSLKGLSLSQQQYEFSIMQSLRERQQQEVERNNRAMNAINALQASASMVSANASLQSASAAMLNATENQVHNRNLEALKSLELTNAQKNRDQELYLSRIRIGQEGAIQSRQLEEQKRYNDLNYKTQMYRTDSNVIGTLAELGLRAWLRR